MKDKDPIILLRSNGYVSLVEPDEIDKATRKETNVSYVLIDVGLTTSEYLVIPREDFIRKFKGASIEFDYHVEVYVDSFTNPSEVRHGVIVCKNVVEFYRAVHSLMKIKATCLLLHDDFYNTVVEGKLTEVTLTTNIKGKINEICVETESQSDSRHDVTYVIETLNYMVYGDPGKSIIPDIRNVPKSIYMDLESRAWYRKYHKNTDIMSVNQNFFECTSFIPKEDFVDLAMIGEYHTSVTNYIMIEQNPLPDDVEISSRNISELDGYNLEVLRDYEMSAYMSSVDNLIELLTNMKYIYDSSRLESKAAYGELEVLSFMSISYRFKRMEKAPNYGRVVVFNYDVDEKLLSKHPDIYADFVRKLRKNYKKFMRGLVEDNE